MGPIETLAAAALLVSVVTVVLALRYRARERRALAERDDAGRARDAMREALSAAERRVDEIARASERAQSERARFLASASHDLRQPIHAITLFVAALKLEPLDGRARYLVDRLDRSLSGLDELFSRLLDIARLDGGSIAPQPRSVGIASLLRPLGPRFEALAAERGIDYRMRPGPDLAVVTDPALLVEIVMNLLSNAFRYTRRGGVLLAVRRRGAAVRIEVWDTGVGIPPEHLERVFDEFVQLHNPSHDRRRGVGLGLAVVRRIATRLGHDVRVRSRAGRGSVFSVTVPLDPDPPPAPSTAAVEAPDAQLLRGLLVLVVDNELEVLLATEALLRAWGCLVLIARNLPEASRWIAESERFPDVLVTDYRLDAGVLAPDVVAAVAAEVPTPLGVLVVTAEPPEAIRGAQRDGWIVLPKPVDGTRMRAALIELVRGTQPPP